MFSFYFYCSGAHRDLHSFPTRRSSDLGRLQLGHRTARKGRGHQIERAHLPLPNPPTHYLPPVGSGRGQCRLCGWLSDLETKDRKSTRLNSSHVEISYAVFCLKKKKKK